MFEEASLRRFPIALFGEGLRLGFERFPVDENEGPAVSQGFRLAAVVLTHAPPEVRCHSGVELAIFEATEEVKVVH